MSLQIVSTEAVPAAAHLAFADLGHIRVDDGRDPGILSGAEVLIVRTRRVDQTLLDEAARLRVIARTGVGLDSIDLVEATSRGVPVLYAPDAATLPIAEGTLALIFATSKRLAELGSMVKEGRWQDRYRCDVRDLAGSTLGIVGLGRIGSEVARLAAGIGMRVIAYDPWLAADRAGGNDGRAAPVSLVSLEELLKESDVLSLHCALTESSRGLISREILSTAKPGAILINASRGGLIANENDLLEALDQGWLSAVGLDVFAQEPPNPQSALLHDPRVVATPHAIGLTRSWNERVFRSLAADVQSVIAGELPQYLANPEALTTLPTNGARADR